MDPKHAYHSVSYHYSTKMMRTSLAVGVVWVVASLCLAIITGLVFVQVTAVTGVVLTTIQREVRSRSALVTARGMEGRFSRPHRALDGG